MHISITAEPIFHVGEIAITNSILTTSVVVLLVAMLFIIGARKLKAVPKGLQNIIEFAIESLYGLANGIVKDEKFTRKIFPFIATLFIFILFNNWFGLLPGVGTIGFHEIKDGHEAFVPLFRAGTADLNTTLILGLTVVILTQIIGVASLGALNYSKKFINF